MGLISRVSSRTYRFDFFGSIKSSHPKGSFLFFSLSLFKVNFLSSPLLLHCIYYTVSSIMNSTKFFKTFLQFFKILPFIFPIGYGLHNDDFGLVEVILIALFSKFWKRIIKIPTRFKLSHFG